MALSLKEIDQFLEAVNEKLAPIMEVGYNVSSEIFKVRLKPTRYADESQVAVTLNYTNLIYANAINHFKMVPEFGNNRISFWFNDDED